MRGSTRMTGLVAGIAVFALGAGEAGAATLPSSGGSTFDRDAQGWTSTRATCSTPAGPAGALCTQENTYDGSAGNPAGSLVANTKVLVNAGEVFHGDSTWRSPSFTAPSSSGASVLQYDRRLDVGSTVALSPRSSVETVLVDEAGGTGHPLGAETLTQADSAFATRRVSVAPGTLAAGHAYHIELRSTTTTSTAREGILGDIGVRYDNVALSVNDSPGASGSPGVTFPGSPVSSAASERLSSSLSLYAEVGHGPGGSLVGLSRCTILGTPGNDRITGSSRNDVICGLGGNDVMNGAGGKDIIDGGNGNDRLSGGSGRDLLLGLRGRDRLDGGSGADRIGAGAGSDRAAGRAGNDRLVGASGNDRLSGGRGADRISGGAGRDRIAARDRVRDRVNGGAGRDRASVDSRKRVGARKADRVRGVERMG